MRRLLLFALILLSLFLIFSLLHKHPSIREDVAIHGKVVSAPTSLSIVIVCNDVFVVPASGNVSFLGSCANTTINLLTGLTENWIVNITLFDNTFPSEWDETEPTENEVKTKFEYFELSVNNGTKGSYRIYFSLDKGALGTINPGDIRLFSYLSDSTEWAELPTTVLGEQSGNVEFYAETSSFFKFFIGERSTEDSSEQSFGGDAGSGGGGYSSGRGGGFYVSPIQFDSRILEISYPLELGKTFNFTYFIKGIGKINHDVIIDFWVEKDSVIITSGSDTIFMSKDEEKTEIASLVLPGNIKTGVYKLNLKVNFNDISSESHRTIELTIDKETVKKNPLFDISSSLEKVVLQDANELKELTAIKNLGNASKNLALIYTILDEQENELHRKQQKLIVEQERNIEGVFQNLRLSAGRYTLVLKILHDGDVIDSFKEEFIIIHEEHPSSLIATPPQILILILVIIIINIILIVLIILLAKKKKAK